MKKLKKPITEVYVIIDEDDSKAGTYPTFNLAKEYVEDMELSGCMILKVVQVWEASYPEEPQIEITESSLDLL